VIGLAYRVGVDQMAANKGWVVMRKNKWLILVIAAAAITGTALAAAAATAAATGKPYRQVAEIHIGGAGQWDYLSVDAEGRRLYLSHGSQVEVIDIDSNKHLGTIADTPGVHGIAIASGLKRGFASNGREAKVSVIDLGTMKTLSKVSVGEGPDAILYEAGHQEVYTFNGRAGTSSVFNAVTGAAVATIKLPGKPEFAVNDAAANRVYNNIEDKSVVAVIDANTHQLLNSWPSAPCESASGLALDVQGKHLFLGCENRMMVMLDINTGKIVATVPIGAGVDATVFDPVTQLAMSSTGSGSITIAHVDNAKTLRVVQTLKTVAGARTMTLDPKTHNIYVAATEPLPAGAAPAANDEAGGPPDDNRAGGPPGGRDGGPPGDRAGGPPRGGRPAMKPDSFKVLVYSMQ
jgi:DNA-binding beta-propeller fold protein YncE